MTDLSTGKIALSFEKLRVAKPFLHVRNLVHFPCTGGRQVKD
jgi:hypothetical protein